MRLGLQHSYGALPSRFYVQVSPTPVENPQLIVLNTRLCADLGLDLNLLECEAAAMLSGNQLPQDASPLAMAYAGHQFGVFVPRLGDGRAILLGELKGRDGVPRDIQLKGSGRTPFSRDGDGRAALGPMLREYLISEAMHALGVPTTRSLAVVATGEPVYRDTPRPGAILTRVAASHVRVGTFQYFAARADHDGLRTLLEYVITRHYPAARDADSPAVAVLQEVAQRQLTLIAHWMSLGFIHGVMNTDNMAVSGETIDYGPCAFMDEYDPRTVFSSIDRNGRYAYANQAAIAQWNLARFAETLLPLIDPDTHTAIRLATAVIEPFIAQFDAHLLSRMSRKIGLASALDGDAALIRALLSAMQQSRADFTLTFRQLTRAAEQPQERPQFRELFAASSDIDNWLQAWQERLSRDPQSVAERAQSMGNANPAFIPRNHRVELALSSAERGDHAALHRLLRVLSQPYDEQPDAGQLARPPQPSERVLQTFCGT